MKWQLSFVAIASTFPIYCSALIISQNTIVTTFVNRSTEDIYIKQGSYYWLLNNERTDFGGSVDIEGSFFVTSIKGVKSDVTLTGDSFHNTGKLEFNTLDSHVDSSYSISPVTSFHNSGEMYLGVSGSTISRAPMRVTSGESWTNTGMMVFECSSDSLAPTVIGSENGSGDLQHIINNGAICLYNSFWNQTTNIAGNGCISVGEGSKLELQGYLGKKRLFFAPDQTINLETSTSELNLRGLTQEFLASYPLFKVTGFGGKNSINIDRVFKGYFYNPETGILKLKFVGPYGLHFDIGKNYEPSRFQKGSTLVGSFISYRGNPPNDGPTICSCKKTFPDANNLPSPDT